MHLNSLNVYGTINISKLHLIVHQPDLLSWLECWQSNIRTPITSKSISKRAVTARANLSFDSEVDFIQIIGAQLSQICIGILPFGLVFGIKSLC